MDTFFVGQPVIVFSPNYEKGSKKIKRNGTIYGVFTHHVVVDFSAYKEAFTKKDIQLGVVDIISETIIENAKEELLYA
ncbi:MAG: hypothetical protein PWR14_797 [Thermosediminibacterales bacterium]|nr:hypothetical protein [Thermosediminibacterales bacterium]